MVDPQYQHARHGGGRGEDHHGGVVHADDRGLVGGREALHHRHQEHRHVQHRGDAKRHLKIFYCYVSRKYFQSSQRHLLPGLGRDEEDEERDDVDEDCWLDVVEQEELGSPPHHEVVPEHRRSGHRVTA